MENLDVNGLVRMISTGTNLIYVVTDNERRTEGIAAQAAARIRGVGSPYLWSCTQGLTRDGVAVPDSIDPLAALDFAIAEPGPLVFIFRDITFFWKENPFVLRKLKDFAATARALSRFCLPLTPLRSVSNSTNPAASAAPRKVSTLQPSA